MSARFVAPLAVFAFSTTAGDDDPNSQIRQAYVKHEEATSVEIQQSEEQTSTAMNDGKPLGSPQSTTETSTIEIDSGTESCASRRMHLRSAR